MAMSYMISISLNYLWDMMTLMVINNQWDIYLQLIINAQVPAIPSQFIRTTLLMETIFHMNKSSNSIVVWIKQRVLKLLMMIYLCLVTGNVHLVHRIVIDAVCFQDIAMAATVDLHYSIRLVWRNVHLVLLLRNSVYKIILNMSRD